MGAKKQQGKASGARLATNTSRTSKQATQDKKIQAIAELERVGFQYKEGYGRPFFSSTILPSAHPDKKLAMALFVVVMVVGLASRIYGIKSFPIPLYKDFQLVEAIQKYMYNQFFIDIYPPYVKLFSTFFAFLLKFQPSPNRYTDSNTFPETFPYLQLRFMGALHGVFTILLMYLTFITTHCDPIIALITTSLIIFDGSNIVIDHVSLYDSIYLCFLVASIFAYFQLKQTVVFTKKWFKTFYILSLLLGAVASLKITGFATIAWVLLLQFKQAWVMLGDLNIEPRLRFKNVAKFVTMSLIFVLVIPLSLFFGINVFNLRLLSNTTSSFSDVGYSLMLPLFKSSISGNNIMPYGTIEGGVSNIYRDVILGSRITIRHVESLGGYLHSHNLTYPTGSQQQQVTLYDYLDVNNEWIIEDRNPGKEDSWSESQHKISYGSSIKLRHAATGKYLRVNDQRGPVSEQEYDYEVTCDGEQNIVNSIEDVWVVNMAPEYALKDGILNENITLDNLLHPVGNVFRLKNRKFNCHLLSHDIKLPEWGNSQQEVICVKDASLEKTLFYIELNQHQLLERENAEKLAFGKMPLFEKFIEYIKTQLHFARLNKYQTVNLSQKTLAETWATSENVVSMVATDSKAIVFANNIILQYAGLASIAIFVVLNSLIILCNFLWFGNSFLLSRTPCKVNYAKYSVYRVKFVVALFKYNSFLLDLLIGYFLHYYLFIRLGVELFATNYMPAYMFLIFAIGYTLQMICEQNRFAGYAVAVAFVSYAMSLFFPKYKFFYGV